ncbi:MAG: SBBP repeat-containing protein, partial [Chitinophagaceae bacterium]|nr:SBBP repeat-containing protein [Chitinophagaceae bacterium]
GTNRDFPHTLYYDEPGNIYLLGSFSYKIVLGSDTLLSNSTSGLFLSKISPNGDITWSIGLDNAVYPLNNITTDQQGNVYLAASVYCNQGDTVTVDNQQFTGRGKDDIYVLKINSNGTIEWIRQEGGKQNDYIYGITTDDAGYVYTTGTFTDTAQFDTTSLYGYANGSKVFICKYDSYGNLKLIKSPPVAGWTSDIKVSSEGSIYTCGQLLSNTILNNDTLNFKEGSAILIKYDSAGNIAWARNYLGQSSAEALNIALVGDGVFMNIAYDKASLVKYDSNGNVAWTNEYGPHSTVPDIVGLSEDHNNGILVTGYFGKDNAIYGEDTLSLPSPVSNTQIYPFLASVGAYPANIQEHSNKNSNITLYPHPNNGHFIISGIQLAEYSSYEIINSLGTIVCNGDLQNLNNIAEIDTKNIPSGMYILNLYSGQHAYPIQFLVR